MRGHAHIHSHKHTYKHTHTYDLTHVHAHLLNQNDDDPADILNRLMMTKDVRLFVAVRKCITMVWESNKRTILATSVFEHEHRSIENIH